MSEVINVLENGRETLDQTPVSYPLHFERPEPLHIRIRRMIIEQMMESRSYDEVESFEEADDFSVPDNDPFESSPYEMEDDFDHLNDPKWKGGAGGETSPDLEAAKNEGVPPTGEQVEEK